MQARSFPPAQGWQWLKTGFAVWRRAPLMLIAASITLLMTLFVALIIPLLGQFLASFVLLPLGVGMFLLCGAVRAGQPAQPGMLFRGFRLHMPEQVVLGLLRIAGQLLVMWLAGLLAGVDGSAPLLQVAEDGQSASITPELQPFMLWGLVLGLPLEMLFWFSPVLIALAEVKPMKAVFFSAVACWRNLGAICVFFAAWAAICVALPAMLVSLAPALLSLLAPPALLIMMPVFYASFHAAACDIFGEALRA
ncbi:BPSS1780 family membrane protein [Uliginosibacterium sp. 31-12]|uniref:BPSS1780 family membrane protein n=1 Tax=Uliginosibacterium sp. 31-12 TaxID=3062781 RepID=UPI0026E47E43|nr:BPSS1780 family membrane protein [Uliginosibacterium sp. 31-12]MDO6386189.1 BPSS1780 family membrane protein [Uliginosibacterium sp. 31-12]